MNVRYHSYQLIIHTRNDSRIEIGRLGLFLFPEGYYVYTGSAKKNILARIRYHTSPKQNLHWHIDYMLGCEAVIIEEIHLYTIAECRLNKITPGEIIIPGFGATDCKEHCCSHLKYQGKHLVRTYRALFR